ncbi:MULTISPECIES: lysozyme [Undibacterium]|uniref:Lysozyme n=1 Tax=Undibacterium luofuense TaxID=2828733 RepID=A0A941DKG5_9BURK|nr:lysozyme [Undibacterium luofuense]MBR7782702.1 lysozyme [Undibacterium luofuense]
MATDNIRNRLAAAGIAAALSLIITFEGTRQNAYLDPVSIPTICRGHTGGVKLGQTATIEQCDELTVQDLLKAKAVLDSCVKVPLNNNQRAAFTSFIFNVGPGKEGVKDGFCVLRSGRPSTMLRLINAGDAASACREMSKWVYAGDKALQGLVRRRAAERELCLRPE